MRDEVKYLLYNAEVLRAKAERLREEAAALDRKADRLSLSAAAVVVVGASEREASS